MLTRLIESPRVSCGHGFIHAIWYVHTYTSHGLADYSKVCVLLLVFWPSSCYSPRCGRILRIGKPPQNLDLITQARCGRGGFPTEVACQNATEGGTFCCYKELFTAGPRAAALCANSGSQPFYLFPTRAPRVFQELASKHRSASAS